MPQILENHMNYLNKKIGILGLGIALIAVPSTVQAQNFTRKGAVAGAVIGAIAGSRNDRPLGGAVIGGVIGGVAGNAIDRSRQSRYRSGYRGYGYQGNSQYYGSPYRGQSFQRSYYPVQRVYQSPVRYGGRYGQSYYRGSQSGYYRSRGW